MAIIQAYSSMSVTDYSDVGQINFYLTSNQPTSVIYDPNTNGGTYTPNWATSNLVITPVISYNGSSLALNASGLTIVYKRKEGSNSSANLTTGETVANGVLTVSANKLSSVTSGQLTYICTVTYTDVNVGTPITSEASLTYNLVTMASELKYAGIVGENAFLYDTNRNIVGSGVITLNADLVNCSVSQWQYKNSSGNFVAFPTTNNPSVSEPTLIVRHDEADIWLNGKTAVIKLTTDENSVYDIAQITKISDGAPGNSTIAAVLSNESHVLPCDPSGTVKSWNGSSTEIMIYEGGTDVTSQCTITVVNGPGLTGSYDASTHVYTPTALTQEVSYADFTCVLTGYPNIMKRYAISKNIEGLDGKDAVLFEIQPSTYVINLNEEGDWTPASVTFDSFIITGDVKTNYSGRFVISESTDGGETFVTKYTSGSDENTKTHIPMSDTVDIIRCALYKSGGTSTLIDEQSVIITRDGISGQDGDDGVTMGLGNYSDVIPCNESGNVLALRDITIPFYAYQSTSRIPVTATVGTLPSGVSVRVNTAGTSAADGLIILRVVANATLGNVMTGDITITLTADSKSVDYKYCFTKSLQAADGTDAIVFQLYSEDGGTVEEGRSTTIKARLYSGATDVTDDATYVWKEFREGSYVAIGQQISKAITITDSMVTDQMLLKCEATYPAGGSTVYSAYYTVDDITDPISAVTIATVKEFKNNQGFGAIYTRLYRNGVEIDQIKSTTFSDTPPSLPETGDFYYHLDIVGKTCDLKKYNGTAWVNAPSSDNDEYVYVYRRIDSNGTSLDTSSYWKQGRAQYVDPSIINGRMQFICEITKP